MAVNQMWLTHEECDFIGTHHSVMDKFYETRYLYDTHISLFREFNASYTCAGQSRSCHCFPNEIISEVSQLSIEKTPHSRGKLPSWVTHKLTVEVCVSDSYWEKILQIVDQEHIIISRTLENGMSTITFETKSEFQDKCILLVDFDFHDYGPDLSLLMKR
jgi:hypothetical protein